MKKIIGTRVVSFTTKEGDLIEGHSVYYTEEPDDLNSKKNLEGIMCDKVFLNNNTYNSVLDNLGVLTIVGLDCEFTYNKYGKVVGLIV